MCRYIGKCNLSKRKDELLQSHRDIKGYLMYKLNVNEEIIEKFLDRWPVVLQVDILKMEELIDMLHQYGFTNDEILIHGRIFKSKITTLRTRMETLKDYGLPAKITILMFSKKNFNNFVKLHTVGK